MSTKCNHPLLWAFLVALVISATLGTLLYLNEDLRTSTFTIIEEEKNEEGEIVRKVKVERLTPNEDQIREISNNREIQQREKLKEKAKDLRDILRVIESAAVTRKEEIDREGPWDRITNLAVEIELKTQRLALTIKENKFAPILESAPSDSEKLASFTANNASEVRTLAKSDVTLAQALKLLESSHEMVAKIGALKGIIIGARDTRKIGWNQAYSMVSLSTESDDLGRRYQSELEQIIIRLQREENTKESDLQPDASTDVEMSTDLEMDNQAIAESNIGLEEIFDTGESTTALTDEEINEMSTQVLFSTIQEMALAIDDAFAENRAAELAVTENLPIEEARDQIYKPVTDIGPDLSEQLGADDPSNLEEYEQFNDALNQAERAAESMRRTAQLRQNQVVPSQAGQEDQTAEQLQNALQNRTALQAQMARAAYNVGRESGNVQDMRAMMMQSYGTQGSDSGAQEGRILDMSYNTSFDSPSSSNQSSLRLYPKQILSYAIPGRRFSLSSERRGWVFLDTWYVIGPWDRPKLNAFKTKFPPETVVDLDATYTGKSHRQADGPIKLKWRFVQTENIRINPPDEAGDSVYYAFTEIFAETAMEVLVAVASDDMAKVWVNDLVVWEDSGLSPWRLDEGFRRIMLKAGYNTVLVRLDNGPSVSYFSVLMCPSDALATN